MAPSLTSFKSLLSYTLTALSKIIVCTTLWPSFTIFFLIIYFICINFLNNAYKCLTLCDISVFVGSLSLHLEWKLRVGEEWGNFVHCCTFNGYCPAWCRLPVNIFSWMYLYVGPEDNAPSFSFALCSWEHFPQANLPLKVCSAGNLLWNHMHTHILKICLLKI